ncbi:MAG: hypothetical protein GEV28_04530 [Actinophytocola sp.]|uniref:hypothetical protein n=1 Tax=Actinophytocola sp. TaxID=1872138 RepID=UPI00132BBC83|nr:hypothetical protein [Actinophytocola sp.]MPZ79687.1 hypothetical protein [Actinophytocola sp.]
MYETVKALELRDALEEAGRTGNMTRVEQLVNEMAAESEHLSRDQLLGTVLFTLAVDAGERGDTAAQTTYTQMLAVYCSEEAVDEVMLAAEIGEAARQGWLEPKAYDDLAAKLAALPEFNAARQLFAGVERREHPPEPNG